MCGCGKGGAAQSTNGQSLPSGWLVTFRTGMPIRYTTRWETEIALTQDPGADVDPAYTMPDGTIRGVTVPAS